MATAAQIDILRSLGFASISAAYTPVGTAFNFAVKIICITNNTNGDMFFSNDGINDKLFLPAGTFKLFDLQTNKEEGQRIFELPIGTQISVRQSTAATSGSVYVEIIYG